MNHQEDSKSLSDSNNAFTLIELLTVIAIIGILAAILIPVVGSVRNSARTSTCLSQLRQAGMGMLLYAEDHGGRLPGQGAGASDRWHHRISPYLDVADDTPGGAYAYNSPQFGCTNNEGRYAFNTHFMAFDSDNHFGISLDVIRDPSRKVMLSEKAPGVGNPRLQATAPFPDNNHGPAANHRSDGDPSRGGPTNYLFSDGHVSTLQDWPGEDAFDPDL